MTPSETVLAVIRGDAPPSALRAARLNIRSKPDFVVEPALADISRGLLKHLRKPKSLQRWADLLVHVEFIDIRPAESSPEWDAILGALWDASSGAEVSAAAIDAARTSAFPR